MRRFLLTIFLVIGLPIGVLLMAFILADPFKTIYPFDVNVTNATNREYQSTELFLYNVKKGIKYDSFIFCSSKGANISVEQWAGHLRGNPQPFLFQAWSETLTGIELKIKFLDRHNYSLKNVLILLDYPYAFREDQLPHETLALKHYMFTHQNYYTYNAIHFLNFLQTPQKWYPTFKDAYTHKNERLIADSINNGMCPYFTSEPAPDSLCNLSQSEKEKILSKISNLTDANIVANDKCITPKMQQQLMSIKDIFSKHNTEYKIIICPEYCFLHPVINDEDLVIVQEIFGQENVYCFSGKNDYTTDIYQYSDQNHFGKIIGYSIIEEIYKKQ